MRHSDYIVNVFLEATSFKTGHRKGSGRFRKTASVTHKSRISRPRSIGQRVQPEDALAYALAHLQSSTREISEHCGFTKSHISTLQNEVDVYPYRPTPVQTLIPGDVQRRSDFCKFVMNRLHIQPTLLADIIWTDEASFSCNIMYNKQNIHSWALENPGCAVEVRHQIRWLINVWCGMHKTD